MYFFFANEEAKYMHCNIIHNPCACVNLHLTGLQQWRDDLLALIHPIIFAYSKKNFK